ncbi:MAG TPA: PAS domain S-box protein [Syntrophorhabdales bacterium]|nr:PAS domain S-box protein [Syntrophorhabdales bacterium]
MKKNQSEAPKSRRTSKSGSGQKPDALRKQAERRLSERITPTLPQDAQKLLHELEVHQIELEMQNEALRQAQDTIIASRERYADLYDFAPVGYFTFDHMGLIAEVNLTGASLLGVERSRLSKKPFSLFVAASSRDVFHRHYRDVLRTGTAGTCELQLTRKDGTSFYASVHSVPVRDAEGNPTGARSAIGDITERKQAEETQRLLAAVQEEKDRISALVNSIQDEVWFADTQKRFTLANPSALREFGLDPDSGMDVEKLAQSLEVYRPDGTVRPVDEAPPLRALQGEVVRNQEEMIRTPGNGELRYRQVTSAPVRDRTGAIIGSVSVVRDITERKRAERALRDSEARYHSLVEFSPDAILVHAEGKYVYANPAGMRLFGARSSEEVIGSDVLESIHPDHRESMAHRIEEACAGAVTSLAEIRFLRLDGSTVDTEVTCRQVEFGGRPAIQIVARDITARKRVEEALKKAHDELELRVQERTAELSQAYEKLEAEMAERTKIEEKLLQAQKMEAIGTLAGGIAHDFNNILAGMIGFSELAVDEIPANSKARRHLKKVLEAGLRARKLVKQILAFSRKSGVEQKQLSLAPLVHETHALLRASLPATIQMPLAITTSDDDVLADPTQIQQVLMNLATNAAYAMRDEGGQLTIGVSSVTFSPGDPLPDPDMEAGAYVKLTVKDTGTGMTEEVRQRIFDPFFTTKEREKGTGMGLAVVYGIVKSHGGAITVQSEAGQGSTFEVFLPQAQKAEVNGEEETTSALPTGTERILFVDDEEMLVEMGQTMLQNLDYHVVVAQHPTEAWNLFLEDPSRFDLVITDQTMPDMTGVTLARKMLRVRKEMPIILCTGCSEAVSPETAKDVGIRQLLMKPLVKQELAQAIRRVLDTNAGG